MKKSQWAIGSGRLRYCNLVSTEIALKALHIPETIKKLGKQMDKLLREKAALTAFLEEPLEEPL